jgi:hypothetical protein
VIRQRLFVLGTLAVAAATSPAAAEPIFLSRQYARCTNCHFSPTGGGLLTPYGRALSREELSSFGRSNGSGEPGREHEFLFGLLPDTLPVSLGIELRPSRLDVDSDGFESTRNLLMNADLTAAMRLDRWTLYAQIGRQPRGDDPRVASFEHWVSYESGRGLGFRVGRFLPAYGVKLADHTSLNRASVGLDNNDQVYAVELSFNGSRHLVQASVGPGRADSVDDDAERAFTVSGRWQFDLRPRVALVTSGLYRGSSERSPASGAAGLAVGIAPTSRLTVWTQADARFREGVEGDPGFTFLAQASLEAYRGLWLFVSPQLLTEVGDASAGVFRLNVGLDILPRTHWNVVLSFYRDRDRRTDRTTTTLLAQLHLYL